jgi:hypothetical protein
MPTVQGKAQVACDYQFENTGVFEVQGAFFAGGTA